MSDVQRLYELQTIDLEIEAKERRLAEVEASLGETDALQQARASLQQAKALLQEQETQLHDLDLELGTLSDKIKQLDARLYGGTVRSPKELSAMEQDLSALRRQRSTLEDRELELMVMLDDSRTAEQARRTEHSGIEAAWCQEQEQWEAERAALVESLTTLRAERQTLAGAFAASYISIYEDLRRAKRGRAVARVEQNTCQGCRITLPTQEVQRARLSPTLVFCSNCGRIIWAAR